MSGRECEIAIVGGGLAGGLIALAIHRYNPGIPLRIIEAGATLGGNHRWSWFDSDLDRAATALMQPFRKMYWEDGYEVRFPACRRILRAQYNSLTSADFYAALKRELPEGSIMTNRKVSELATDGVTLANGDRIEARTVIDCRGFEPSSELTGGWQVFMGRHVRTSEPHGLERPVIMDANVDQHDAYRFVYTLPLGAHELFVEDTYYADSPYLDRSALSRRLDEYCDRHGWTGDILGGETGVLPVITGGRFKAYQMERRINGVAMAGARGGFAHPLTSYTLPFALRTALLIAENAELPGDQLGALLEAQARNHWRDTRFYRRLGAMLFGVSNPNMRYRIFERFYRLPEGLIERFYAGKTTLSDRIGVLTGRPPMSIASAINALLRKGKPLLQDRQS